MLCKGKHFLKLINNGLEKQMTWMCFFFQISFIDIISPTCGFDSYEASVHFRLSNSEQEYS